MFDQQKLLIIGAFRALGDLLNDECCTCHTTALRHRVAQLHLTVAFSAFSQPLRQCESSARQMSLGFATS
jgi:hypothetical protein